MSIHGKGPYQVRWRDAVGRNRQRTFDRWRDANEWDTDMRRARQRGHLPKLDKGSMTMSTFVASVMIPTHLSRLAPRTQTFYLGLLKVHILPTLGTIPLRAFTVDELRAWQERRIRAGGGVVAVNRAHALLRMILKRAMAEGQVEANVAVLLPLLPVPPSDPVRPLAPITVERVRAEMGHRDRTIVSALAYNGERPSELWALRRESIFERTVHIHKALDGVGGVKETKTGQRRSVRLFAAVAKDLDGYIAAERIAARALLFSMAHGGPATKDDLDNWRERVWRRAWLSAGARVARETGAEPEAPLRGSQDEPPGPRTKKGKAAAAAVGLDPDDIPRPYDLRHSFASLLLAAGHTVHYVAAQLGHDARMTLSTYGHIIAEFEDAPRIDPEAEITKARATVAALASGSRSVRKTKRKATHER